MKGHCAECGAVTRNAGEYHPFEFCALKKAGLDPWQTVQKFASDLGLGDPPPAPPLLSQLEMFRPKR